MTSRQVELFLSVAKHLNFTKASQENHVSQPTTSRQIAQLEEEWGVELFYRDQNTVQLTAAGNIIAEQLTQMMDQFETLLASVRDTKESVSGSLSIGYLGYLNSDIFVHPLVAEFTKRYPNVKLTVESATFSALASGMGTGDYDVIFVHSIDLCFVRRIHHINCCPVSHMIALSSSHPLASKENIQLSDLSGETFLLPESAWRANREQTVLDICKRFQIENIHFRETRSVEDMIVGVRAGQGIALVTSDNPCFFDNRYLCLPVPDVDAKNYIAAVWSIKNSNAITPLFTQLVEEQVAALGD